MKHQNVYIQSEHSAELWNQCISFDTNVYFASFSGLMDRRGFSECSRSNEQDNSGGSGRASPSDAYYRGGAPQDHRNADRTYYGTNNNDYSKYAGGSGEYLSQAPSYNAFDSGCAGGYYDNHTSPEYCDNKYAGYSRDCHLGYGNQGHKEYSGQPCDFNDGNSHCYRDEACQGLSACDQSQCSGYSECRRPECQSSRVEVTAKVLFGSVSAISNLKQKKSSKKKWSGSIAKPPSTPVPRPPSPYLSVIYPPESAVSMHHEQLLGTCYPEHISHNSDRFKLHKHIV